MTDTAATIEYFGNRDFDGEPITPRPASGHQVGWQARRRSSPANSHPGARTFAPGNGSHRLTSPRPDSVGCCSTAKWWSTTGRRRRGVRRSTAPAHRVGTDIELRRTRPTASSRVPAPPTLDHGGHHDRLLHPSRRLMERAEALAARSDLAIVVAATLPSGRRGRRSGRHAPAATTDE